MVVQFCSCTVELHVIMALTAAAITCGCMSVLLILICLHGHPADTLWVSQVNMAFAPKHHVNYCTPQHVVAIHCTAWWCRCAGALWGGGEQVSQSVHCLPHAPLRLERSACPEALPVAAQPGEPQ